MIRHRGKLLLLSGSLLLFVFSPAQADPPGAGCQPHQMVNPSLAGFCRQNAETLKKKKAEYEELLKKKTESMQKSASAFAAGDQTTEAAVENAKRMFSTMASEQDALIKEVEKKRKDVGSVQQNYEENIGKMLKSKSALVSEINQKNQFIANEKRSLQELQMGRDPNNAALMAEKQKRISVAEAQLAELNKKRTAFDSAISADRASQGEAKILSQKFTVSESELNESATKLRGHHARLSGLSLESASKEIVAENKARDDVAAEKAKLAELSATEGSKKFDSSGKALPSEESGSQKGVRAALAEAKKGELPDTADVALMKEGERMAADGQTGKYFKETPDKATEFLVAEQSLGTAKDSVQANEKALADIGGEKGLADRLKKSSAVYSDLEANIDGMPSSDAEGLRAAKDQWAAQYKKDCENRAVCNALNSYGIKPELTTGTTCVGSGICGVEKKVWDANSGLNDIPVPTNGEQVVKTEGISTELRVAAKRDDFAANAGSRLAEMNADTLKSAQEVQRNADIAAKSTVTASGYDKRFADAGCNYNSANTFCQALISEKVRYQDSATTAKANTFRWDPLSNGQVKALADNPKHSGVILDNAQAAALVDRQEETTETVLGFAPVAGSAYGLERANTNLEQANAAAVRTGGKSEVAVNNLVTAQEDLSSAKTMMVADVAMSATGVGGLTKGGVKAGVNAGETLASAAVKSSDNLATPLLKNTDHVAEAMANETKVAARAKDDLVSVASPTRAIVSQADEAASTAKAQAFEDVRLSAVKNQSARSAELRAAETEAAEIKLAADRNSTSESLRLARQTEADNAAAAKASAERSAQSETNALLRQNELAAKRSEELAAANENVRLRALTNQSQEAADARLAARNDVAESLRASRQAEASRARADELAAANENVRLNALKKQSDQAAEARMAERNNTAEELRLARQIEADRVAAAEANASRAVQSEANALRRQQEANSARFQAQLNDNVPLAYPKAAPEFKAAGVSPAKGPKEITIYPDTVPEMLQKQNIAHTKIDDTQALVTPGPQNKISRTAAKVENKYGTKVYVDEAVDEHGLGGWANKDEIALSRAGVKSKVDQGPLLSHEVEHVNNSAKLAKSVDEGKTQFDWRNITFGSPSKPTGIQQYDQMGVDEVMAYRRSYNQYRFDGNAALKTGDNALVTSADSGAEAAAYHYGEKLSASTTYLRSADDSLGKMIPSKLASQQKTVATSELPLGAPSRSAGVKSVTVKEIRDNSGGSMRLVNTRYADNKEFTSMLVDVRGNNGSAVPMTMPVPNSMMNLPEKVAVSEAKGYVGQALGKLDNYEILYQKSAAKKADLYATYTGKPSVNEPIRPGVVGGDTSPRILNGDRKPASARGGQLESLGLERAADDARSGVIVDDPNLIGVRVDGPNAVFKPRELQEIADRRVNWVLKEHAEFSAISSADNRKFMDLAARAEKGEAKESFFVTENAVLKRLNDDVVKDKDFVTALDNLHKDVLLREIQKDPVLKEAVVASYNDYKSIGFALKRDNPNVRRLLDEKIAIANEGFNDFLKKVEISRGWKEKSMGLASDMRTWHHSGIGKTFQEAGLAARRSRELALDSGNARLVNFADESAHYVAATDRMTARSSELATKFKSHGFLEKTPHGTALSEEAIETIRKAKPLGKSEEDMNRAVSAALKKRYGREVSQEEAALLRAQLKDIDAVNPSLLIEKRVEINMGLHDEGVVSFDFKGQNSRNLYQTQMAILKSKGKDIKSRLEAIAEGDRIATAQLDDMKARVEKAVSSLGEKYVGKDISKVVQKSGDDGIFHPLAELGPAEKAKLAKALNEQKVGDAVRLTYLPKNYRNSKELIPVVERNRLVVEAEKIEKDLFTEHLVGELPDDVFKGLQVKVDLNPAQEGKSAVGVTFSHASGKEIPAKAEEIARRVLDKKYDISYIERSAPKEISAANAAKKTKSFAPISIAKEVDSENVLATTKKWDDQLRKMGAEFSPTQQESALKLTEKYRWYDSELTVKPMPYTDGQMRPYYGEVFRVDRLPPAVKKADPLGPALTHPEMESYVKKMREMGYDLVVDTSQAHVGMSGYFNPNSRVISLAPNSNWVTFVHEFQHLEFFDRISQFNHLDTLKTMRLEDKLDLLTATDPAFVKAVGANKLRQLQGLLDRGVTTETAINESLSVAAELKSMGWKRYIPGGEGEKSYRYMLRHQISDLEKLGPAMTEQQQKLVKANKVKHLASEKAPVVGLFTAAPVVGAGAMAGGLKLYESLFADEPSRVYYDTNGNLVLVYKDGSWRYGSLKKN